MMLQTLSPFVLSSATLIVCVALFRAYRREQREGVFLSDAIAKLHSSTPLGSPLLLRSPALRRIWSALLRSTQERQQQSAPTFEQLDHLSNTLHLHRGNTAAAVVSAILHQCQPEAVGCAMASCCPDRGLRLEACEGIPAGRIREVLLTALEGTPRWGYQRGGRGEVLDLSVFDIGSSYLIPLYNGDAVLGAVWIGFSRATHTVPPERRSFVEAVTNHAVTAFRLANTIQRERNTREEEKRFLLGVSHDLRAPTVGALYLLRELQHESTPEAGEKIRRIQDALNEQQQLISDFLDYARHEKGVLSANRSEVSLPHLLEEVLWCYTRDEKLSHLRFTVAPIPHVALVVDRRQLRRILGNLLTNAFKYTDQGEVNVTFTEGETHLEIAIRDSGIGIAEEYRPRLFSEFSRAHPEGDRPGVGLGLALTKVLVEENQGYLRYEPNPAGGSVFTVGLELARAEAERRLPEHPPRQNRASFDTRERPMLEEKLAS